MGSSPAAAMTWRTLTPGTPDSAEWSHPGIAVDPAGTVFGADPAGGAIVVRTAADDVRERITVPLLEIHGITHDGARGAALWLADPGFKMRPPRYEPEVRDGTAGRLDLKTREFSPLAQPDIAAYAEQSWRPTAVACADRGLVVVTDGYGAGLVHVFDDTGHRMTLDGSGSGTTFRCPHDVAVVRRGAEQELVVADRGNQRLAFFGLDGVYHRSVDHPLFRSPTGLAVDGDDLLVADVDGALLRVHTGDDSVTEVVPFPTGAKRPGWPNHEHSGETRRPELTDGVLNSPHAVASAPGGSVHLAEYVIGGREIRLTPR